MKFYNYETYIPNLKPIYEELEKNIGDLLPLARIEHVGASSVEGSISKGDLDILVAVEQSQFEKSMNQIKSLGFYEKKDTLRTDELCMLVTDKYEGEDVAIQLIVNGSNFENFLSFRELLRSSKELLSQYNELKKSSINLDQEEYRNKKSLFISSVLGLKGEAWKNI